MQAPEDGKRRSVTSMASALRATPIKSSESPRSWIVNSGESAMRSAYRRRSFAPALWKVPAHGSTMGTSPSRLRRSFPTTRPARVSSSTAARRLNVRSRMRWGSAPSRIRRATRWAMVLVLPVPAPAMTSSGPCAFAVPNATTRRWASFSSPKTADPSGMGHSPRRTFVRHSSRPHGDGGRRDAPAGVRRGGKYFAAGGGRASGASRPPR